MGALEGLCRFRLSSGSGGGTGTAGGNIQEQGKSFSRKSPLIVATAADSPRFSYVDTTSRPAGDLVGFEVALIKEVAHVLGREVVFKKMDYGVIIPCVLSGQASIAIAQFEGTPERANNIDFSEPYCVARLILLSLTSTPVRLPVSWKNKMIGFPQKKLKNGSFHCFCAGSSHPSLIGCGLEPQDRRATRTHRRNGRSWNRGLTGNL